MTPVELLDDHHRRPRNLGKLIGASAIGDIGSIIAGDALRFYILADQGRITQAKFQVFNCQAQLAATSVLSEMAVGKTLAEAYALDREGLCAHVGGLDPVHLPVQLWGQEALRVALNAFEGRETPVDRERPPLLCRCHDVDVETVRQAIIAGALTDVEAVGLATGAGTGCGSCQTDIRRLLEHREEIKPRESAKPVVGRIATLHRIAGLVAETAGAQRGQIEPWDIEGDVVVVRCTGLLISDAAMRQEVVGRIEGILRAQISPAMTVAVRDS